MESSRSPGWLSDLVRWAALHLVRSVAGFGVSSQAKVVVESRASRQVPGGLRGTAGEGGRRAGRVGAVASTQVGALRARKPGHVFEQRCRFKVAAGLSSWKCRETGVFSKKCPRRLMRVMAEKLMAEKPSGREARTRVNWISLPTKQVRVRWKKLPGISWRVGRRDACRRGKALSRGGRLGLSRQRSKRREGQIARQRRSIAAVIGRPG